MAEYIEREAVLDKLNAIPSYFDSGDTRYGITLAANEVRAVPAADVEPVRHGQWEHHLLPLAFKCSCCGYRPSASAWKYHSRTYCPNCGAHMDGKEAAT